jgi:hypothetical protein
MLQAIGSDPTGLCVEGNAKSDYGGGFLCKCTDIADGLTNIKLDAV